MFGVIRFKEYYQELESLFTFDPLLVFAVAYVCPRSHIENLCGSISLPYAIAFVANELESVQHIRGNTEVGDLN